MSTTITARPTFLIAVGDANRVEVLRSPVVRDDDSWLEPVHQYIDQHHLAPVVTETITDDGWMFGEVEVTVYAPALVGA